MEILDIRHAWPEKGAFLIDRPLGREDYTFLHFFGEIDISVCGEKQRTAADACCFYAPNTPQWFHSDTDITHDWMHIDSSLRFSLRKYGIAENRIYYPQHPQFITELFQELENEWFSAKSFRDELIQNKLEEFLITFSRSCNGTNPPEPSGSSFRKYREIRKNIILNLDHHWTIREMADTASISQSRFLAVYKQLFGTTPMNDLIYARINAAKNRLLTEDIPVFRLASELGYTNQYHFIRQFTKTVGCSPTAYRKSGGGTPAVVINR